MSFVFRRLVPEHVTIQQSTNCILPSYSLQLKQKTCSMEHGGMDHGHMDHGHMGHGDMDMGGQCSMNVRCEPPLPMFLY